MAKFLVTTIRRHCPLDEPSGYIYVVDTDRTQVLQRSDMIESPYRVLDDNPRGGMRGSKGIVVRPDEIAIANFSFVFRYDLSWNLTGVLSHPSCSGIHDIQYEGDDLWVTAASVDMLMRFERSSGKYLQHIDFRRPSPATLDIGWQPPVLLTNESIVRGRIDFRDPTQFEKETYDRAHVNSLSRLPNGDLLVSLGFIFGGKYARMLRFKAALIRWGIWPALKAANQRLRRLAGKGAQNMDANLVVKPARAKSAIVRVAADGRHTLVYAMDGITAPSHSLLARPDGTLIYLKTTDGTILHIEPDTSRVLSATHLPGASFLRGVTALDETRLLVGDSCQLLVYDVNACRLTGSIPISADRNESVYDVKQLPEGFGPPPESFAEHFSRETGCAGTEDYLKRVR